MTKRDYILQNCEFYSTDQGELFIDNGGIVGNFCSYSFGGLNYTKEECIQDLIDYFNDELNSNINSIVKNILITIDWKNLK